MKNGIWSIDGYKFNQLNKDISTDILIIGGGLTGISLLYYLRNENYNITLIEGNKLLNSTTAKSTAKLTPLQQDLIVSIEKCYNKKRAKLYYDAQVDAIKEIVNIINDNKINCDLLQNDTYVFINDKKNEKKLLSAYNLYKQFGADIKLCDNLPMDINIYKGFFSKNSYVFHPVKYGYGLVELVRTRENIEIFEHTRMLKFYKCGRHYKVFTNTGNIIKCKYLIIASNYPSFLLPYFFPLKVKLEKSCISISKHNDLKFNAISLDDGVISIRFYNNNLIRIISSYNISSSNIKHGFFDYCSNKVYDYTNYDVMTSDGLPIVDKFDKNLILATGYNTWGMTNSNLAARIIRDLILNEKNKYYDLTCKNKKKSFVRYINIIKFSLLGFKNFMVSHIKSSNKATVCIVNGKRYGIYIDNSGKRHYVKLTCPHMKCGLFFDQDDKTWCCPCHGSKFDIDGNIIKGPSTKCITKDI